MPYQLFHDLFPDIADQETRTVTVLGDPDIDLPPAEYAFCEMFCNERGCDCRRVFFYVISSLGREVEAVIAYGWESPAFYAQWLHDDDPDILAELQGPVLNMGSPQSELADGILELFCMVLLKDQLYIERIKRHYQMFRERIDGRPRRRARRGVLPKKKRHK